MLKSPYRHSAIVDCKRICQVGLTGCQQQSPRTLAVAWIGPGVFSMASLFALPALLSEKQGPGGMLCVPWIRRISEYIGYQRIRRCQQVMKATGLSYHLFTVRWGMWICMNLSKWCGAVASWFPLVICYKAIEAMAHLVHWFTVMKKMVMFQFAKC